MARKPNDEEEIEEADRNVKPYVNFVEDAALERLSHLDPRRMVHDYTDPSFAEDPDFCALKARGPPNDVHDDVRGFVASIIQAAMHRVYEWQLGADTMPYINYGLVDEHRDKKFVNLEDEGLHLMPPQPAREESELSSEMEYDGDQTKPSVTGVYDELHPDPNIKWPTIGEFNQELGLNSIEEFIKGWQLDKSWLHCTDAIGVKDAPYEVLYQYRVRWSIPTRRAPIPRSTVSVYFTIQVSKVKPKNHQVDVYYQLETFRTKHRPGEARFSEKWLHDLVASKSRLMLYVNF